MTVTGREPPMEPGQPAKHGPKSETGQEGPLEAAETDVCFGSTIGHRREFFVFRESV